MSKHCVKYCYTHLNKKLFIHELHPDDEGLSEVLVRAATISNTIISIRVDKSLQLGGLPRRFEL